MPMPTTLRYWWPLAVTGGCAAATAAVGGWQSAVMTAGWVVIGGRMTSRRFDRHRRQATAQIQQSTSSPLAARRNTYFDDLIAAAQTQMSAMQASAQDAEARSAHAEARGHLARRDASRLHAALAALPVPTILLDSDGVVFAANAAAGEALPEARPGERLPKDGPVGPLTSAIQQIKSRGEQAEEQVRELALPAVTRGPRPSDMPGENTDDRIAIISGDLPAEPREEPGVAPAPATKTVSAEPTSEAIFNAPSDRDEIAAAIEAAATSSPESTAVRTYQTTVSPLRSNGRLIGVVVSMQETTDRDEIRQQCAQFLGAACHELKTPMASIRAHVELLADGDLETPEEQAESLSFIDEQADRLARLVENMLNLARIQSGLVTVNRGNESLADVLAKPFELLKPAAAAKSITLVDETSDLYMAVHVDTDLFGQAVTNLLSNAIKYTPDNGEVRLRSRLEERHAVIDIQDSGLGIPPESLPHIFDKFYRVPENNHSAPGTGLGLSLVQFIAEDVHGGEISVESEVGQGSVFTIRLPIGHFGARRRPAEPAAAAT